MRALLTIGKRGLCIRSIFLLLPYLRDQPGRDGATVPRRGSGECSSGTAACRWEGPASSGRRRPQPGVWEDNTRWAYFTRRGIDIAFKRIRAYTWLMLFLCLLSRKSVGHALMWILSVCYSIWWMFLATPGKTPLQRYLVCSRTVSLLQFLWD